MLRLSHDILRMLGKLWADMKQYGAVAVICSIKWMSCADKMPLKFNLLTGAAESAVPEP